MKQPISEEVDEENYEFLRQVGLRIKLMRERSGLTRREMTEKANLKPAYGYLIEGEGQNFTLKTLNNLSKVLGCLPRDLMPSAPADVEPETENHLLRELAKRHLEQLAALSSTANAIREALERTRRLHDGATDDLAPKVRTGSSRKRMTAKKSG